MADSSEQRRIPELDGLRGIAILLVLAFHFLSLFPDHRPGTLNSVLSHLLGMGWTGVDLFFVLSGFLIGGILLDARASPSYFRTFYARRFFRIVPLYYTWIGLYAVLIVGLLRNWLAPYGTIRENWVSVPIHFFFLQNVLRVPHTVLGNAWLGHLWSLAIEEQFYLLIPLIVWFLVRPNLVVLLCTAIVGAPILRLMLVWFAPGHPAGPYLLSPCRADSVALGVLLAVIWRNAAAKQLLLQYRRLLYIPILLLVFPILYLAISDPSPYGRTMSIWGYSVIDFAFAFLLALILAEPRGFSAAICRISILQKWGRISYCGYIIHPAVFLLFYNFLMPGTSEIVSWRAEAVLVLGTLAVFGIANLSWIYFERPLLHKGHSFKY